MSFKALASQAVGLCNRVLGDLVAYTRSGGSPLSIKAIFDNSYVEVAGIVSLHPILRIDLGDLDELPGKGDTVSIDSVNYVVQESRLDGHGGSTLVLKKS